MSLEDAPQAYQDFEARKVSKIVFKMGDVVEKEIVAAK